MTLLTILSLIGTWENITISKCTSNFESNVFIENAKDLTLAAVLSTWEKLLVLEASYLETVGMVNHHFLLHVIFFYF